MTSSGYGGVDLNLISTTQIDIFFAGCISPHRFVPPYLRNGACITDTKKKKKKGGKQTRSPVQEQPAGTLMSVASCNITRNSTDPRSKNPIGYSLLTALKTPIGPKICMLNACTSSAVNS
jgi:hypothetical protein